MDTTDAVTIAASLTTSAEAAKRVLGPTLDHFGERLLRGVKASEGLIAVLLKAERKAGTRLGQAGSVAPRVAREVLEQAWWTEDEICAEYLGGVLASARTMDGRDDRGLPFAAMIGRLSSFDLRSHYILYRAVSETLLERGPYFGVSPIAEMERDTSCLVSYTALLRLISSLEADEDIDLHTVDVGLRSLDELNRENLISSQDVLHPGDVNDHSLSFRPTRRGFELFLWGLGLGHLTIVDAVTALGDFTHSEDLPYLAQRTSTP